MTETDGIVIEGYEPGPVEVLGRRLKMEYVGMASVFVVIAVLIFGGSPWLRTLEATTGSFFLFLGLKKKNRDHLMCSMHLFGAALLARAAVFEADWALPLLLFGATVFSAERYLEKKPQQVAFLPVILGAWAWFDGSGSSASSIRRPTFCAREATAPGRRRSSSARSSAVRPQV